MDGAELDEDPAGDTEVGNVELTEGKEEEEAAGLELFGAVVVSDTEVEAAALLPGPFFTGQVVTETAMTEVVVMVECAGQLTTDAAQLVMT